MPVRIGTLIDRLHKMGEKIDVEKKIVKKAEEKVTRLQAKYDELEGQIFNSFKKNDIEGAKGAREPYRCEIERKEYPTAANWPKIYAHIVKNKDFDLLQKRLSTTAARARWDDGKSVPGMGKFTKTKLKLTKVKKR